MPGIIGLISQNEQRDYFSSMIESVNHYDYQIDKYVNNGIHLGRIYHNFISEPSQPYILEDKNYFIVFHGEIFSYNNDIFPEQINFARFFLERFIEKGPDCLKSFNGQYQVCIYNSIEKKLYLISDRYGTRPLYYTSNNERMLFAPEVKALIQGKFTKKVNYQAISDLFYYGHLLEYRTLFENIYLLPEASYLIYADGKINHHRYWEFPYIENAYELKSEPKKKIRDAAVELEHRMLTAVERQTVDKNQKILIPLSGGLDSRWVIALAKDLGVDPLITFTMGSEKSEDQVYARMVAKHLNTDHTAFDIQPEILWSDAKHFSYLSDAMSIIHGPIQNFQPYRHFFKKSQYVIAAQMCDALFGSTLFKRRIRSLMLKKNWDDHAKRIFLEIFMLTTNLEVESILHPKVYDNISDSYLEIPKHYIEKDKKPIFCYFKLLLNEHVRRGTLGGNVVNNLFFETRMPSYDNDLIEFAFNLPIQLKINQFLYRYSFSQRYPALAKIPREGTRLPINVSNFHLNQKQLENRVINRAKKTKLKKYIERLDRWNKPSYVSYAEWFNNELRSQVETFILDKRTLGRGIFIEEGIKKILNEHFSVKADHHRLIWQIINLELFYRNFID
jgi:asparagine synthase (glutamine-hydrolysing)